ncbi:adenylate kinase isoenzyme 5-like isoform X2 [Oscarella lobularis]|uniref:adenylate kinase isoenzyme 5-like isoform X2 n=1 Tax=Oscarella lobularis TaxID=121494 RepID=UPI0033136837
MNNEDAKKYLYKRDIPQLFESLMTGLMYSRPDNPVVYLQSCLSQLQDEKDAKDVEWNTFLPKVKPAFEGAGQPLPPIKRRQPEEQGEEEEIQPNSVAEEKERSINPNVPLPPIGNPANVIPIESCLPANEEEAPKIRSRVIFVLGGPGSGKGTQCERIVDRYGLTHLSAGDLLRAEVASGSDQGKQLEEIMREGKLVPLEITLSLLESAMIQAGDSPGFLIDGFPRELQQATEFEKRITAYSVSAVLCYECSEDVMTQRLLERGKTSGRADDNEETIRKRFETFRTSTMPVLDHYRKLGKLKEIDADRTIDDVFVSTCQALDEEGFEVKSTTSSEPADSQALESDFKDARIIFVLGGPGSGKGTQCERIVAKYGLAHFSTGDLLRAELASGSEKGKQLEEIMKEGKLVPMEVIVALLKSAILKHEGSTGFLIDGFPRETSQAAEFESQLTECQLVLSYECSEEVMTKRLLERGKTSGRADDNEETIRKRFKTFRESTMPVLNLYEEKGQLKKIDADRSIDEVFHNTSSVLEEAGFRPLVSSEPNPLKGAKVVFVLGGPGSGKGTQCERIVAKYGLHHFSAGDLLREEVASGSDRGQQLSEIMKEGKLVPMAITISLLESAMLKTGDGPGFLIDGFPREISQGLEFEKNITDCSMVLCYECSEEVMTQRLLERGKTSGRADDNEETIKKRFHTFRESTMPVLDYYEEKGKLKRIIADKTIEEVFEETSQVLAEGGFQPTSKEAKTTKIVFVLGGPGSGKGTQCERIVSQYGLVHFSAGDLLRAEVASGSKIGKQLEEIMKEGKLVPLEITIGLLEAAMLKAGDVPGFLIDGFPREINQALEFEKSIAECSIVLSYECTEDVMTERLLERGKTSGRADDNEETIRKRLETFRQSTMPVLDHYEQKGKLRKIDANRPIDEVFHTTKSVLDESGFQKATAGEEEQ